MDAQPKASLLIVDDTPANLRLLRNILTEQGYKVRIASDGLTALHSAHSTPPDLILLDIMMPQMDGYTVCAHLKADKQTSEVPVIFLSALNEPLDKVKAFAAGGVDYITKPFHVEEVLARVETHLALHRLQHGLERQIAELDAFAHTVAHDLKNPLAMLVGYTGILTEELADTPDPAVQECLNGIVRIGLKMANIVDELLLLARVRKVEQVVLAPLDMAALVSAALERLKAMIEERETEISLPSEWPLALGYGPWVEEIWANYISNAVKYGGRPSRIELGADLASPTASGKPEKSLIRFWVRDNGPGLAPAEQEHLFTEFTQLHQVRTGGYGLGLSIVRRIAEKLGGQVGVESQVGHGSAFSFSLPAAGLTQSGQAGADRVELPAETGEPGPPPLQAAPAEE